jgi:DNA-binding LytR/AlgR family response regulator
MNVFIIEDEKPALENIIRDLGSIQEEIRVLGVCGSIRESLDWLKKNKQPDLILSDIQLSDGPSFHIFKSWDSTCPVIFITAYDKYLTEAFEYNSIDYLLKPVDPLKLGNAIIKYKNLQNHFVNNYSALSGYPGKTCRKKTRIVVKRGIEFQAIKVEDIAYFFTEHKLVFLVDKENRKYVAEKSNLAELEDELDNTIFYRANRKYIVNADYIKRFKPVEKSKLILELILPVGEDIVISQENSPVFKKWISEM